MPAKTEKGLLAQHQEMSASNAALMVTEIAGAPEIHTEGGVAADQEAVAADHHPEITREEAAVIPETMADQRS